MSDFRTWTRCEARPPSRSKLRGSRRVVFTSFAQDASDVSIDFVGLYGVSNVVPSFATFHDACDAVDRYRYSMVGHSILCIRSEPRVRGTG